jgi:hypothetical protein
LPEKIAAKISSVEDNSPFFHLNQILKPHFTLAGTMITMFVLLWAGITWFDLMPGKGIKQNQVINELAQLDFYGFDEAMLVDAIADTITSAENIFSEQDIINYLLLEEADISSLLIEM